MPDQLDNRPRRRLRRASARRIRKILVAAGAIVLVLALGNLFRFLASPPAEENPTVLGPAGGSFAPVAVSLPSRPNYNYSVIPRGARDARELARAIESDAVVADHYRTLDPATMRPWVLKADRLAHVSYRIGDRVYWTKHKVRIYGGETILTNGQTEIRARCGNCISMEPLLPTSADEPDPSEFDALADTGPLLVSWNLNPFGPPPTVGAWIGDSDPGQVLPLLPVFPFGPSVFTPVAIPTGPGGGSPGDPTGGIPTTPPFGGTTPPGGVNPPFVPSFPGGGGPVGDPSDPSDPSDPFELQPLLDDDPDPPPFPPTPTSNTTPIPEPATFLLLGSGIAGLVARHWRSRTN